MIVFVDTKDGLFILFHDKTQEARNIFLPQLLLCLFTSVSASWWKANQMINDGSVIIFHPSIPQQMSSTCYKLDTITVITVFWFVGRRETNFDTFCYLVFTSQDELSSPPHFSSDLIAFFVRSAWLIDINCISKADLLSESSELS